MKPEDWDESRDLPLVSVIVPAYNAEAFISQTLVSVLAQSYPRLEILVVDDGSQDRTPDIVRDFVVQDRRVVFLQQSNQGVAAARNTAIAHATGSWIAPIDADDIWYPHKIAKQVQKILEADASVGLVYTWSVFIDEQARLLKHCQMGQFSGDVLTPLVFSNFPGNSSSVLIRRACLEQVGGYDSSYRDYDAQGCEDWDLYLRIAAHYQFLVVPELLVGYRQSLNSMSSNQKTMHRSFHLLQERVRQHHPDLPESLFLWAKSNFSWYQATRCYRLGEYPNVLIYLAQTIRNDHQHWFRPKFYGFAFSSVLKILVRPIAVLFWPDHMSWMKFRNRLLQPFQTVRPTSDLSKLNLQKSNQLRKFPHHQYRAFLARRFSQAERLRSRTLRP